MHPQTCSRQHGHPSTGCTKISCDWEFKAIERILFINSFYLRIYSIVLWRKSAYLHLTPYLDLSQFQRSLLNLIRTLSLSSFLVLSIIFSIILPRLRLLPSFFLFSVAELRSTVSSHLTTPLYYPTTFSNFLLFRPSLLTLLPPSIISFLFKYNYPYKRT